MSIGAGKDHLHAVAALIPEFKKHITRLAYIENIDHLLYLAFSHHGFKNYNKEHILRWLTWPQGQIILDNYYKAVERIGAESEQKSLALMIQCNQVKIIKEKFNTDNYHQVLNIGSHLSLNIAAEYGYLDLVEFLIAKGADVNQADGAMKTALHYAAEKGHIDVVKLLVKRGAKVNGNVDVNGELVVKKIPLHLAIANGHFDVVKYLLENGADINQVSIHGESALHLAIQSQYLAIVKFLVEEKNAEVTDEYGSKTLHPYAVRSGDIKLVKYLVEKGAKITSLYGAVRKDSLNLVKYLVENGASVHPTKGESPIHIAADVGDLNLIKFLVENGADVNQQNAYNETPLHLAAQHGYLDIVEYLIKQGANHNSHTRFLSDTPLNRAVSNGHLDVVKYLAKDEKEVRQSRRNYEISVPFHLQNKELLKFLKEFGMKSQEKIESPSDQISVSENQENEKNIEFEFLPNATPNLVRKEQEFKDILTSKGPLVTPLEQAKILYQWYTEQNFLTGHNFHHKKVAGYIVQKLAQLNEEDFTPEKLRQIIIQTLQKNAEEIRQSFFGFWKNPASYESLNATGHFKAIEIFITKQLINCNTSVLHKIK